MRTLISCLHIAFLLLVPAIDAAAQGKLQFRRLTQEDGLAQGMPFALAQDPLGFIWISTKGGMQRYDGTGFTMFLHDPADPASLPGNSVIDIVSDGKDTLWLLTRDKKLATYNVHTGRFATKLNGRPLPGIETDGPITMIYDPRGVLWLLSFSSGVHVYQIAADRIEPMTITRDGTVVLGPETVATESLLLSDGSLLVPTSGGHVLVQDPLGRREPRIIPRNSDDSGFVVDYAQSADGSIFFFEEGAGLSLLDPARNSITRLGPAATSGNEHLYYPPDDIHTDRRGLVWITCTEGVVTYDPQTRRAQLHQHDPADPDSLTINSSSIIMEDATGNIWISSTGRGISIYSPYANKFRVFDGFAPDSASGDFIYGISPAGHESQLWIGQADGNIICLDTESGQRLFTGSIDRLNPTLSATSLHDFVELPDGRVLMAADTELLILDPDKRKLKSVSQAGNYHVLQPLPDGRVLAGSNRIELFDGREGTDLVYAVDQGMTEASELGFTIHAIQPLSDGGYWAGTDYNGLLYLPPELDRIEILGFQPLTGNSEERYSILSLLRSDNGQLWVGTSAGLFRLNAQGSVVQRYDTGDGLPDRVIYGIEEDLSGNIWLGTNRGLVRLQPDSGEVRTYTIADGLPGLEFNRYAHHLMSDGSLAFGSVDGLVLFQPETLLMNRFAPAVHLTAISSFDREMRFDRPVYSISELTLSHNQDYISFEFAALDYSQPSRNRYRYWMENFDVGWIEGGTRRFANYTNLPPGRYTFHVQGSNSDGVWSDEGATLALTVKPPFWDTPLFYLAVFVAIALVLLGLHLYRTATIRRQRDLLQREVEERRLLADKLRLNQERLRTLSANLTIAEEQERRRIALGLHDTVGQNLAFSKRLVQQLRSAGPAEAEDEQLQMVLDMLSESIRETKELTFQLSPPVLYELGLGSAINWLLEKLKRQHRVRAEFLDDGKAKGLSQEQEVFLFQCIREALYNALKHASADHIEVLIRREKDWVHAEVGDDGIGFNPEELDSDWQNRTGYGLYSVHERISYYGGSMQVESEPGKGTRIIFKLPVLKKGDSA